MSKCIKCIVRGRVQGVFFRASTQQQANNLGLTGYAINRRDGHVEVLACGEEQQLAQLKDWLVVGPSAAQVTDVQCEDDDSEPPADFRTGW